MNEKLNHCTEMVELLRTHLSEKHSFRLEWGIIALIAVEVRNSTDQYIMFFGKAQLAAVNSMVDWYFQLVLSTAYGAVNNSVCSVKLYQLTLVVIFSPGALWVDIFDREVLSLQMMWAFSLKFMVPCRNSLCAFSAWRGSLTLQQGKDGQTRWPLQWKGSCMPQGQI